MAGMLTGIWSPCSGSFAFSNDRVAHAGERTRGHDAKLADAGGDALPTPYVPNSDAHPNIGRHANLAQRPREAPSAAGRD